MSMINSMSRYSSNPDLSSPDLLSPSVSTGSSTYDFETLVGHEQFDSSDSELQDAQEWSENELDEEWEKYEQKRREAEQNQPVEESSISPKITDNKDRGDSDKYQSDSPWHARLRPRNHTTLNEPNPATSARVTRARSKQFIDTGSTGQHTMTTRAPLAFTGYRSLNTHKPVHMEPPKKRPVQSKGDLDSLKSILLNTAPHDVLKLVQSLPLSARTNLQFINMALSRVSSKDIPKLVGALKLHKIQRFRAMLILHRALKRTPGNELDEFIKYLPRFARENQAFMDSIETERALAKIENLSL